MRCSVSRHTDLLECTETRAKVHWCPYGDSGGSPCLHQSLSGSFSPMDSWGSTVLEAALGQLISPMWLSSVSHTKSL